MKYLFFDLEYANSKGGIHKICEFGYVLTDEKLNQIYRENFIIDPNISRKDWDYRVVRKILKRPIEEYEHNHTFLFYYERIKNLINSADYIVGHTLNGDAKALNDECQRYDLPSLDYKFYDVKNIYKAYSGIDQCTSLENIVKNLNIDGEDFFHDAETDAYNTMLVLKTMLETLNFSFEEVVDMCPESLDETSNYTVKSDEESAVKKLEALKATLNGDGTNDIVNSDVNTRLYYQFIDNLKPIKNPNGKFKGKVISFSLNYENHHFKQIVNLYQMIVNEGGFITLKVSESNIFVKYDIILEDGSLKIDSRYKHACLATQNIEVITIDKLLDILNITEEELDNMPLPSFDFIFEKDSVIKDKKVRKLVDRELKKKEEIFVSSIGDILMSQGIIIDELVKDKC